MPPNLSWGDSRPYAVLLRTLDEDCRQAAEEPKQLVDEATRFHLGHQRQHCCHLLWRFAIQQQRDTVVPAEGNGDLQTLICVLVVRRRRCLTLSNPVSLQK